MPIANAMRRTTSIAPSRPGRGTQWRCGVSLFGSTSIEGPEQQIHETDVPRDICIFQLIQDYFECFDYNKPD